MNAKIFAIIVAGATLASGAALAEVKVSTKGGLKVSSGEFKAQIGGRIHYDYNRSELNGVVDESAFEARRARVFIKGDVSKDWGYKINWNVDGSGFEDLFITYKGWGKAAQVTIGKQLQPFTLSQLISSKDNGISERPAIIERYTLGRQEGVQLHGDIDNFHYGVSYFTQDAPGRVSGSPTDNTEEDGLVARTTFAPVKTANSLIHVGAAYKSTRAQDGFGIELAGVAGAFHVQAEYFDLEEGTMDISGQYIQAGFFLTGEVRPYKSGVFKRIKPSRPTGAWEIVVRYEDGDGNFSDMELGREDATAYGFGVNYYANNAIRINTSYEKAESNEPGSTDEGEEFRVRFQLAI